jgi:pyruvate formate lyase activating enzyme
MPKEAMYYDKLEGNVVQCHLCPKNCVVKKGEFGNCNARQNIDGKLYSMVYGKVTGISMDPVEKKPLFHFLPGKGVFSIGTSGCNLHCKFCQNWNTSQVKPYEINVDEVTPAQIVKKAIKSGSHMIAYTYNEPIIFYEFVLETAKLAKKKGLKNIIVCNGFIQEEPLKALLPYLDAANIDLKSFEDKFYRDICSAWLEPVLNTLKILNKSNVHLEITNLVIPKLNDKSILVGNMCKWIKKELGDEVPLHFSRFFPCYLMHDLTHTSEKTLSRLGNIAKKEGLKYVYIGNIKLKDWENTYCSKCGKLVIERDYYNILQDNTKKGKCMYCNKKVSSGFN